MSDKARWTVGAADPSGNSWDVFKTVSPREALDKLEELQAGPLSLVSRKGNQVYYVYDSENPERGDAQILLEEMLYAEETREGELSELVGATVEVASHFDARGREAFDSAATPVLVLRTPGGKFLQVEAWRDPEGNAPGFLLVTDGKRPKVTA